MTLLAYHTAANHMRTTRIIGTRTETPTVRTFSFLDPICAKARPGQFLMLWVPGIDEIPFSIVNPTQKGIVSIAVKRVGKATEAIHEKRTGEIVGIRGPFGNHFTLRGRKVLMVGGGTGAAPLLFLTRRSISADVEGIFVLGAKTKSELLFRKDLASLSARTRSRRLKLLTSTEDGSCGITGLCTEQVETILRKESIDMVYACGPEQMIHKVLELTEEHEVGLQASLERLMRCAIGLCGSCAIGKYRVCTDGPVFTSKELKQVKNEFGSCKRDEYGKNVSIT